MCLTIESFNCYFFLDNSLLGLSLTDEVARAGVAAIWAGPFGAWRSEDGHCHSTLEVWLLLVRGLVSVAEPERLVELAEALGEVNRREQAAPAREDEGTAAWGEELRRTVQARTPFPGRPVCPTPRLTLCIPWRGAPDGVRPARGGG